VGETRSTDRRLLLDTGAKGGQLQAKARSSVTIIDRVGVDTASRSPLQVASRAAAEHAPALSFWQPPV